MKNHLDSDSVAAEPNSVEHCGRSSVVDSAPRPVGTERALLAQLELSKLREMKARKELQYVRADNVRIKDTFEAFRDDEEKRSNIQLAIHGAEQDHLQRIILDLETISLTAKATSDRQQEEYSTLNTRLLLKVAELEAAEGRLEVEILRLKNETASYSRTLVRKESFGRDKARRLDTALAVLANERSKISNLQQSSSMRIGRLITSSLKHPLSAFALMWRLPRMIYQETQTISGEMKK